MSFCSECGTKLENDDLFCPKCGTKTSGKEYNLLENDKSPNSNHNEIMDEFGSIGKTILKVFLKPVSSAKEFIEKSEKNHVIVFTILFTIMQGILGIWKTSQIVTSLQSAVLSFMEQVISIFNKIQPGSIFNSSELGDMSKEINSIKSAMNIPYGKIFMQNCVLFLLAIIVTFIIISIVISVFSKNKLQVFTIYKAVLICAVPILYFEILSIIFSYISFSVGAIIFILGILISAACFNAITRDVLSLDENLSVILTAVSFVISILAVLLCLQSFANSNLIGIFNSLKNFSNGI